jgi:hypothetical protein
MSRHEHGCAHCLINDVSLVIQAGAIGYSGTRTDKIYSDTCTINIRSRNPAILRGDELQGYIHHLMSTDTSSHNFMHQ